MLISLKFNIMLHNLFKNNKFNLTAIAFILGSISGLTISISSGTINFWLAKNVSSVSIIGFFSLASLPYAFNFIWAPLLENYSLNFSQKKHGILKANILILTIIISAILLIIAYSLNKANLLLISVLVTILAFFCSSLDVILNSFRANLFGKNKIGISSGVYLVGYRLGMLTATSLAIYLSIFLSWQIIFIFLNIFFILLIAAFFMASHNFKVSIINNKNSLIKSFDFKKIISSIAPLKLIPIIMLILILYRMGDNFLNVMLNPFLLYKGYDEIAISTISKFWGVLSSIIGGIIGGYIMNKSSIYKSLYYFAILHIIAHSLFLLLTKHNTHHLLLFITMGLESITGGMSMAAYIAFITILCKGEFSGTKYSLLSSMMGLSRSIFPSLSGIIVYNYGWIKFFIFVIAISIPAVILIKKFSEVLTNLIAQKN